MSVTLDLPVPLAISVLRSAGTGDSLLAALDAIVTETPDEVEVADETVALAE